MLLAALAGCSGWDDTGPAAPEAVAPSDAVTVAGDGVSVEIEPGPHSVLTAVVRVETDEPTRPRLVATAGDHRVVVPARGGPGRDHTFAVVGMRPETTYDLRLRGDPALIGLDGELRFATGSLPADLPVVETEVAGAPRQGVTLFNATPSDLSVEHPGNLIAVDEEGEVVWYHQDSQLISDARQLPDGHLLYNFGNIGAREIDVLGEVVGDWTTDTRVRAGQIDRFGHETYADGAIVLDTPRLHHEVAFPLPNGNFLALSQEIRTYRGFADPDCPPEPFDDPTVRPRARRRGPRVHARGRRRPRAEPLRRHRPPRAARVPAVQPEDRRHRHRRPGLRRLVPRELGDPLRGRQHRAGLRPQPELGHGPALGGR